VSEKGLGGNPEEVVRVVSKKSPARGEHFWDRGELFRRKNWG